MRITIKYMLVLSLSTGFFFASAKASTTFEHRIIDSDPPDSVWVKSVADFDGDGDTDFLIAGHNGKTQDLIIWYENPGTTSGSWAKHIAYQGGDAYAFEGGTAGDLDGDGDVDVVIGSYWKNILLWLENPGKGAGSWKLHELGAPKSGTTYLYDFDGDGKLDIATRASQKYSGPVGRDIWIWKQNNPASWTRYSRPVGDGEFLNLGDVDMDGKIDILFANKWLQNNGSIDVGTWKEYTFTTDYTWLCTFPIVIDINKDGRNDIVLTPTVWARANYKTAWYQGPAKATESNWKEHIIEDNIQCITHALGVYDFDLDGTLDVFTAEMAHSKDPDEVKIYYNTDGKGTKWQKHVIATSGSHSDQFLDFDGDGDIDIIGGNHGGTADAKIELRINNSKACR